MKKILLIITILFLTSCSNLGNSISSSSPQFVEIPQKINPEGTSIYDSSINTTNLDNYMFRNDVAYYDTRYFSWIISDGYISGFKFTPFYDFIATRSGINALFKFSGVGENLTFTPIYYESIDILSDIFPQDKKIFLVSQSGVESMYLSILLSQCGYNLANIYNVGGVINQLMAFPSYKKVGKYFIEGNGMFDEDSNGTFLEFDITKLNLTLIE